MNISKGCNWQSGAIYEPQNAPGITMTGLTITSVAPYDFNLSLRVARSFESEQSQEPSVFRTAIRIREKPAILELRPAHRDPSKVEVHSSQRESSSEVRHIAEWIISAELDLQPFYRTALSHPFFASVIENLHGLKPLRPSSLFEMLIIAITEQQISMSAAYHIRQRLIEAYGDQVEGLWAFPTPERLSGASIVNLMKCGLSHRKAEYVKGLADRVVTGLLDLGQLQSLPDDEVRTILLQERGFGPWSAEYILVRGLSRPDRVPSDDLGIRTLVGRYLGRGQRLTAQGVMRKLAPFKPYRGLAAFYLLAYARLAKLSPI